MVTVNVPTGLRVQQQAQQTRVTRSPKHTFHLKHKPFQIQPFSLAPVLAGESLTHAALQSRAVSDVVKNRLIGAWMGYSFFYVPLSRILSAADLKSLLMDMNYNPSALHTAARAATYHAANSIDWASKCLTAVVEDYFRDEGEAEGTYMIDGMPAAQILGKSWLDSVYAMTEIPDAELPVGGPGSSIEEFNDLYQTWLFMREMKMTEKSYEEYLQDAGVRTKDVIKEVEVLWTSENWTLPANTIADNGSASSAWSWSVGDSRTFEGKNRRFFKEPGFIIGVTVCRPKIFLSGQVEQASALLDNALSWLPAVLKDQVETSLRAVAANTGPLRSVHTTGDGYMVDIRDLFVHGDQFVNYATSTDGVGLVGLPGTTNAASRYPTLAHVQGLFVGTTPAAQIEQDGVARFSLLGVQKDFT